MVKKWFTIETGMKNTWVVWKCKVIIESIQYKE